MKIICFCGIDGSGKTTLIRELRHSLTGDNFIFKGFYNRKNVNLFQISRPDVDVNSIHIYSDSIKKDFVKAFYLDFVEYYKSEIEPLRNTNAIIISDRWFHCVSAFANSLLVNSPESLIFPKKYEVSDLIFYIDVDPEIAFYRQTIASDNYHKNFDLLKEYAIGYKDYFNSYAFNVIRIKNDVIQESIRQICEILNKFN